MGGSGLAHFAGTLEDWKRGEAMDIEVLEQTPQRFSFNVTRCGYAEMYRVLGIPELGELLSCNRDFSLISGFNPEIRLQRTQTIMQGASICDFRFVHEEAGVKTLLIMRHAKSAWSQEDIPDQERPLNKRGKHDAPRMGDLLKGEGLLPDLIISSTAKRARSTVELVAEASDYDGEIRWEESLYATGPEAYIAVLRTLPAEVGRVMVVGHNPGLEELVAMLTDEWARLPTSAVAEARLNISDWADLGYEPVGKLAHVWRPKEMGG
jgi:phosphohistidine phosphatase